MQKNKLHSVILFLLCTLLFTTLAAPQCFADQTGVAEAEALRDGVLSYHFSAESVDSAQHWLDGALTESVGVVGEWYVLALVQNGETDTAAYRAALEAYLAGTKISSASSRLKFALVLQAVGGNQQEINRILTDSLGKQGIMSWVFGLHLLNNGADASGTSAADVVKHLLSLQLPDGGWALTGENGDVDVTAMTLQALAPNVDEPYVPEAIDAALAMLSARQNEFGGFSSYGVDNAESAAQVVTALSALGIDCAEDVRFIKNGNTLWDAIVRFRLADGSYCHQIGGAANVLATEQVFCSLTAYLRMEKGEESFYLFKNVIPQTPPTTTVPTTMNATTDPAPTTNVPTSNGEDESDYRITATAAAVGAGVLGCAILVLCGKRHPKNLLVVAVLAVLAVLIIWTVNFRSADDYYGQTVTKENAVGSVTISIRCDTVAGQGDPTYIPVDGEILPPTVYAIAAGDTVFDILVEAAREHTISLDYSGTGSLVYLRGIHQLTEFAFGDLSGWVYRVNSVSPSVGCGEYVLADGDTVEFLYTLSLGNDLNGKN